MDTLSLVRRTLRTRANPPGRPLAIWGSRGREFKSPQPDEKVLVAWAGPNGNG